MLTDELLVSVGRDSVSLIESRASLSSPCKWPSPVTVVWSVSNAEAPPFQEVSSSLTQSERGADGRPVGSSTVLLMTLEPLDLH